MNRDELLVSTTTVISRSPTLEGTEAFNQRSDDSNHPQRLACDNDCYNPCDACD